ncbi:spore germination protein [Aneurinibacillus migulanus]|uniref:Spore gernimation protein GerA n=1 Tax=Aneurinibacillus migulanus TaxID=47500 RepID=A0A0M0H691_ANEMI|nr:spore germination protein [Aneurinibacillus migulanus]KON97247.1 spore gernimation protein GerA [Aneurinibacillus migulanus]MED0895877.1 spore germination protein [Aneurinibacillus migulanus]MED1618835.1 spore germination protein [Aneurinibacillus migulanus]SDJ53870.1 stage V sporulation protein AF [Aneurinibacillus migulanus]GED16220.1 spore germination protein [Aneurinibacillus migulanus]
MRNPNVREAQKKQVLSTKLTENVSFLTEALGVGKSFDVIYRPLEFGGRACGLFFVDGFAKDDVMNLITINLSRIERGELSIDAIAKLMYTYIGYVEVEKTNEMSKIITAVLSGPLVLVVDGAEEALIIDARTYPARSPDEPDIERVVRGARDGFTETLVFNTALTRRRLRDPSLRMEYIQIGVRSQTDVVISYLEDVADDKLVDEIRQRIKSIDVDGLPMADKTLEEFLFKKNWNPFPFVRYTERPDVAAVHLIEGHVLIYTDTSPSVMITPTTLFHHVQHAEEYRQKPAVGAYLRWVRFALMLASIFFVPLFLLMSLEPEWLPKGLAFLLPEKAGNIPMFVQLLLAEIGIDALRMAAIHTPSSLATALGLVAALMIGDIAVEVGLLSNQALLFLSISAIGTFATPSYEFGMATRMVRLSLLILTGFFHLPGFLIGLAAWLILLLFTRSLNTPYLWPLLPFNGPALLDVLVRSPVPAKTKRPKALHPKDPTIK